MRRACIPVTAGLLALVAPLIVGPPEALAAPTVVNRATAAGIGEQTQSWEAHALDYDNDGDEDVWIGLHQQGGRLWSNDGDGTYTRVAVNAWPRVNAQGGIADRHDCAFADVDGNGLVDAYCSAGRNMNNYVKGAARDNELWLQTSKGNFTDVGTQWGVGDDCGRGRHVTFVNANGDRWPDLFLGNANQRNRTDPCDNPANGYPNEQAKIYINNAGTGLRYAPAFFNFPGGFGQRCAETLDFNNDGRQDLLLCKNKDQTPHLFRNNNNAGFVDVTTAWALNTTQMTDAVPVDFDNDGDTDIVAASLKEFYYRLNTGTKFAAKVQIHAVSTGQGRSVAVGDADGDGDLDVYCLMRANGGNPNDVVKLRNGTAWTTLPVPAATGDGDVVVALHPFGAARPAQFLALNGGNDSESGTAGGGPVQLLTYQP